MQTVRIKKFFRFKALTFFGLAYTALFIWLIHRNFFIWDANLIIGLILAFYICKITAGRFSLRYLMPSVVACTLAIIFPVNTMFFIALLFAILLLIESSLGKISNLFILLLLLISPVFTHITHMGEFPLRLWLTNQVAHVLSLIGIKAASAGNLILLDNYEFSVDQACAGLNMLVMSLLICLFVVDFYHGQTGKRAGTALLAVIFCLTAGLNVACNFFRILLLVVFKIMPGTLMHDLTGIACLAVYVILPLLCIMKLLLIRFGAPETTGNKKSWPEIAATVRYPGLHLFFLLAICFIAPRVTNADNLITASNTINLPGYHKKKLDGGITKFDNADALIYIKPTLFYAPEHDPMICWVGSGYVFKNIKLDTLAGYTIYTATLQKKNDQVYAAWWFDNGSLKTVNQFTWRWAAARGGNRFYLVNVNASSRQKLLSKTIIMLGQNLFNYQKPVLAKITRPNNN